MHLLLLLVAACVVARYQRWVAWPAWAGRHQGCHGAPAGAVIHLLLLLLLVVAADVVGKHQGCRGVLAFAARQGCHDVPAGVVMHLLLLLLAACAAARRQGCHGARAAAAKRPQPPAQPHVCFPPPASRCHHRACRRTASPSL